MNRLALLSLFLYLLLAALATPSAWATPAAPATPAAAADPPAPAPEGLSIAARFFPSCLLDLSDRLTAPAGARGFLFVGTDGHFYFADGARARFWGINVAKDSVFQPHATIDQVCDLFARAGINLVRLHQIDDVDGLLPPARLGRGERLDPTALDSVDYWIAALKKRGIYVYLDLLDYRTFTEEEGVVNAAALGRAAKPVALYNEKLIGLQKEYARDLLVRHVNPYTGLRYRDDPAICLLEICDENSLLATFPKWSQIPSPYREELLRRWNFWLRETYGSTSALRAAWGIAPPPPPPPGAPRPPATLTPAPGTPGGVGPTEKLEDGTVALPGLSPDLTTYEVRLADVRRFASGLERDYLRQMVTFLRAAGVRTPLTAVTDPDSPASLLAAADTLDFLAGNYYYAHPIYKPTYPPGVKATFEVSNMLCAASPDTAARRLCGDKVAGKPLVIREWNACWPNPYRSAGLVESAALAARQDVDAMILFSFYTQPRTMTLSPFDLSRDPSLWGQMALAGEVYRDPDLIASAPRVAVLWSKHDTYAEPRGAMAGDVYDAARLAVLENWLPGHQGQRADAYALISPAARELLPHDAGAEAYCTGDSLPALSAHLLALLEAMKIKPGPIQYNQRVGWLSITGRTVRALLGEAGVELKNPDGGLRIISATPRMALVWLSRDGQPPAASRDWVAKMTTGAWNTGEEVRSHYDGNGMDVAALLTIGRAPVTTGGKPVDLPTVVTVGGKPVLKLWMRGGVWELHQTPHYRRLYCDTGGVRFEFPDLDGAVPLARTASGGAPLDGPPWIYPEGAAWVEVPLPAGEGK